MTSDEPRLGTVAPQTDVAAAAAVRLVDVTKNYGDIVAVDRVSLEVANGEFFALLGPSGCGKTTTLKLIGGFESPTRGTIEIAGARVDYLPPFRRNVNTVFQNYALFPHLDVRDNVAFGLKMKRVSSRTRRARAEAALERVHLAGLGNRQISELSGGQQQRVALARALVNEPAVLLLDEPLGALDLKLRKAMQIELKSIQRSAGISFVYVTHDQEEALTMADRIAVMNDGNVLQIAPSRTIYEQPATRFVASFIGDASFLSGSRQQGSEIVELAGGERVRASRRLDDLPEQVILMVRPENIRIADGPTNANGHLNRVRATVDVVEYVGADTNIFLRTPSADRLVVRCASAEAHAQDWQPGDKVELEFAPEHAVPLPAEAADLAVEGGVAGSNQAVP